MKTPIYLILKYWGKHKRNLAAVIFSGTLMAALIFVVLIQQREAYARGLNNRQNGQGAFDIIISNSDDELLAKVVEGRSKYTYGYINVVGEIGTVTNRYLCGTLHDEHNLYHLPLKEGRMPETFSEIMLDTDTINALYWTGKCGETITLDDKAYTVTGIIDSSKYERYGLQNHSSEDFHHQLPSIFVGESDKTPLYRIDFLGNYYNEIMPDFDGDTKRLNGREMYEKILKEIVPPDSKDSWIYCNYDYNSADYFSGLVLNGSDNTEFSMFTAYIGVVIAILSVFSMMKSVFAQRAEWIAVLHRIGAGRNVIARFYAAECAMFAMLQTAIGLVVGLAAYGGIFAYKVNVAGEPPIGGFSSHYIIINHTHDPFLYTVLGSLAVLVPAYLLCVLTSKLKPAKHGKIKKPRSLSKCLGRVFAHKSVTILQTAALTLICFSVVNTYLYYTQNNKENMVLYLVMPFEADDYTAGDIDMNEEGVAEYYHCTSPAVVGIGHQDNDITQCFMAVNSDDAKGFGDDTVAKLPEDTVSTGKMEYLFIASDEPVDAYGNEVDLSDETVRRAFLQTSSEKYQSFFDEGQLGSKHMYQAATRLADAGTINKLSEYVKSGAINIDAINSGNEVLITYDMTAPTFSAGDKVTLYMAEANTGGYGVGNITSTEVTVGAVLEIPQDAPAVIRKAVCEKDRKYTFLTTCTGALAMGAPSCSYSEAYAYEEVTGAPFPLSAEASVTSLKELKLTVFTNRMTKLGGIVLVLVIMSLLGFAAYFNGIGMKIRSKKYEVSVLRAVGAPVSAISKKLIFSSLKVPLTASAIAYGMVRIEQLIMGKLGTWFIEQMPVMQNMENEVYNYIQTLGKLTVAQSQELYSEVYALQDKLSAAKRFFFLDNGMWNPNAVIPVLILFAALCGVTFILAVAALKKFKRDIAFDINSERTRL